MSRATLRSGAVDLAVLVLGAAAGLVIPFQLFTRTRAFFAESSWLDYTILGASALAGVLLLLVHVRRWHPGTLLLAGSLLLAVVSFTGYVIIPASPFPGNSPPAIDVAGVSFQPYTVIYSLVALGAILASASWSRLARVSPRGPARGVLSISLGGGVLLLGHATLGGDNGLLATLALVSSGLAMLVAASRHGSVAPRDVWPAVSRLRPGSVASIIVSWVVLTAFIAGAFLVLVQSLGDPRESATVPPIGFTFLVGFLPAAIAGMLVRWRPARVVTGIAAGGTLLGLAFLLLGAAPVLPSLGPVSWLVPGIPLGFVTWGFLENGAARSATGSAGVLLLVPLLLGGFLSFMVLMPGELLGLLPAFGYSALALTGLDVSNAIVGLARGRGSRVPAPGSIEVIGP